MEKKKLAAYIAFFSALAVMGLLLAMNTSYAYTSSANVTGQVTVPAQCVISLNASTMNFGSVAPGSDTGATNQIINVTNTGNAAATNTTIRGTQWSSGANTMPVGQTEYNTTSFTYGSGISLTSSDVALTGGNLGAGASLLTYFGVGVPAAQAAGTYNQTITFTMNC